MRWRESVTHPRQTKPCRPACRGRLAAMLARVDGDLATALRPAENAGERVIRIVGLAQRCFGQLVVPFEEHTARSRIGKRVDREVIEAALDARDVLDVIATGAGRDRKLKIGAFLKLVQQDLQRAFQRLDLARDGGVVGGDELRRARLATERRAALPSVVVDFEAAISEPLADRVDAPKTNAHGASSTRLAHRRRHRWRPARRT